MTGYVHYEGYINGDRVFQCEDEDFARNEAKEYEKQGFRVTVKKITEEVLLL
jgi:hypothetical protein